MTTQILLFGTIKWMIFGTIILWLGSSIWWLKSGLMYCLHLLLLRSDFCRVGTRFSIFSDFAQFCTFVVILWSHCAMCIMWSNPMIKYESSAPSHYQNSRNVCRYVRCSSFLITQLFPLCERERVILSMVERTASYERRKKWRGKKVGKSR